MSLDTLADELLFGQLLQVLAWLRCVIASCCDWLSDGWLCTWSWYRLGK